MSTCKNCGEIESEETIPKIDKVNLSTISYIYDGKEKKPTVKITSVDGDFLKNGKDYTLTYKNNKKIGSGIITINFKGKYGGTLQKTFEIVKGKLSLNYKNLNLKLTGKKKLKCTITAYTKEGITAKCKITIKESDLYLFKNHTFKLSKINGKTYKWRTKNKSIATAGKVVTGISQGKTTIYKKVNGTTYQYNVYITDYEKLANAAVKKAGDGELSFLGYYVAYDFNTNVANLICVISKNAICN